MARPTESQLYQELMISEFSFMERGINHIHIIYEAVKKCFPQLCDDNYLCSENCKKGSNQPEWNHTVRGALQQLKSDNGTVRYTGNRGFWEFR